MSEIPPIKYANADGVEIAYQVVGDSGPVLIGTPGFASNIEIMWDEPRSARWLRRMGSFCRLIHYDKRGCGLSDRGADLSSFPERVSDMLAVMDAEGVDRAFIGGFSDGGTMSAFFAATYPERTQGVLLISTTPSWIRRDDLPWNLDLASWRRLAQTWSDQWGTGAVSARVLAPTMVNDRDYLNWLARYERHATTPASVVKIWDVNFEVDIRSILSMIRVPALVIHRSQEPLSVENGRYLAAQIPEAQYLELPGEDHLPWLGDQDSMLDAIEEFVTGRRTRASTDRVLATVLFTDVVDSTRTASAIGDAAWRRLLDDHDALTVQVVHRGSGKVLHHTGDGVLATFDSPSRAVAAATELHRALEAFDIRIRAGLHTGEIERRGSDVSGIGVHIAARVQALAGSGETLASSTVKDLCAGAGFVFEDRGTHDLKGVDGAWHVYRLAA
ncbi:MAG: adenylate/guanylate cyclase domain-containing protein [Solirubrobacteraceae bacterium]